jgi:glycosyltransferase involved in cell wall biosynthesis
MNILFAPSNFASFASITMEALNKIPGVKARGISLSRHKYWSFGAGWTILDEYTPWKRNFLKRAYQSLYRNYKFVQLILWADVVHWQFNIGGETTFDIHYGLLKKLRKPVIIEWLGGDIRVPEIVCASNPYYKKYRELGIFGNTFENKVRSRAIQQKFAALNALPAVCPEISLFVDKDLFPDLFTLYQRIDTSKIQPRFPDAHRTKPVVVHTPSNTGNKGTRDVRAAIAALQEKGLHFEYIEIHNKPKEEANEAIRQADIFLDQFILGSYGMATCEAMAMGKPVFCYLMPAVTAVLPEDCPIVNANLDNLPEILEAFIKAPQLRYETGVRSRDYVVHYHDADKIAQDLLELYKARLTPR